MNQIEFPRLDQQNVTGGSSAGVAGMMVRLHGSWLSMSENKVPQPVAENQ